MGRHDDQARIAHADEHHQHEIGRMVRRQRTAGGRRQFVAVVAGRFVAMMAVGDEDRLRAHLAGQMRNHARIGHRPHAMDHAQMVGRLDGRRLADGRFEQVLGDAFGIGIQAEDLAEVRLAGARQQQAIGLRAREGFFVRIDAAFAEPLQAGSGP